MKKRLLLTVGIVCTLFAISACGNNAPESEIFPTETETEEPATENEEETEPESTEDVESEVETKVEDGEYKIYPAFVKTFTIEDNVLKIETENAFEDYEMPTEMAINFEYPLSDEVVWSDTVAKITDEEGFDWYEWFSFYLEGVTMAAERYNNGQYEGVYTSGEDFCEKNAVWTIVIKDKKVVSISMDLVNADTEKSETAQESKAESTTKTTDTKESKTNSNNKTAESTPTPAPTTAPVHQHNYTSSVTQSPNCVSQGVRTFVCGGCGSSYTESIPCTEHTWTPIYGTVEHPAVGEYQQVQIGSSGDVTTCCYCGAEFGSGSEFVNHARSYVGIDNDHARSNSLIRDGSPIYEQQFVETSPAWTETVVVGYSCSCGATK